MQGCKLLHFGREILIYVMREEMRDSVVVGIRGNVYNWLSYGLCFLVRNSVVLAVYLLFLVSASLPYMSICAGVVVAVAL